MHNIPPIFEHEMEALLQALRRDLRTERQKANSDPQHREWHIRNVRTVILLLEALNPRAPDRITYVSVPRAA